MLIRKQEYLMNKLNVGAKEVTVKFLKQFIDEYKKNCVKKYWQKKTNPCENASRIFDALDADYRGSMKNIGIRLFLGR